MEIGIVTSINKITKEKYPDIWESIIDDPDFPDMEHRRGSTFYVTPLYTVSSPFHENVPTELHGHWESDTCIWSDDWGLDYTPDTLYRVQLVEVEKTIIEKKWNRV